MKGKGKIMRSIICLNLALVLTAILSHDATRAEEQRLPGRLLDEKVAVHLVQWSTKADGAKRRSASADTTLSVGERSSVYTATGLDLCTGSLGGPGDRDWVLARSAHLWWVDVELLEATTQRIELAIDWARYDRLPDGTHEPTREGRRTITLLEGQSHVIDFLETGLEDPCALNVLYELQADIVEDPRLADTKLNYFVWTIDQPKGQPRRLHASYGSGAQGEMVDVDTVTFRWPVNRRTPDGKTADVVARFNASVLGRLRTDGSIDLYVEAGRHLGIALPDRVSRGGIGGGGQRLLNIRPGEAIELVLPMPQGSYTDAVDWSIARGGLDSEPGPDGIAVGENVVMVDFPSFFADHTMSIFVTATIDRQDGG